MAKVSAVAAFSNAIEVSSPTGFSIVSGLPAIVDVPSLVESPCCSWFPAVVDFPAFLASLLLLPYLLLLKFLLQLVILLLLSLCSFCSINSKTFKKTIQLSDYDYRTGNCLNQEKTIDAQHSDEMTFTLLFSIGDL
jgi:hypothetical protein